MAQSVSNSAEWTKMHRSVNFTSVYRVTAPENILSMMRVEIAEITQNTQLIMTQSFNPASHRQKLVLAAVLTVTNRVHTPTEANSLNA